jgi:putative heme-binding domain-containing protein
VDAPIPILDDSILMNVRLNSSLLVCLLACSVAPADDALRARNDAIIVRAIERMPGYDYTQDKHVRDAIERHLSRSAGTAEYVALAKRFRPDDMPERLAEIIRSDLNDSVKVEAAGLLCGVEGGPPLLAEMLESEPVDPAAQDESPRDHPSHIRAAQVAGLLGNLGNETARELLGKVVRDETKPFKVRSSAISGLAKNGQGQNLILQLARSGNLVPDTRLLAGGLLARSNNDKIRQRAAELLPQPQMKDQKPLAPIDELASMRGDIANGQVLFRGVATCANCHLVNKFGKEVGPDLSEIGSKLSREAIYTSILDPSAGISHNYENYVVLTDSGQVITGLKVSETPTDVVIRTAEAIDRRIPQGEIEEIKKSEKSIMPENLHHTFDQKGLVDIVEYMTTLTKK